MKQEVNIEGFGCFSMTLIAMLFVIGLAIASIASSLETIANNIK